MTKRLTSSTLFATTSALLVLAAGPSAATVIGFSGPLAPSQWTTGGSPAYGTVDTSGAPGSITLIGGDNGEVGTAGACVAGVEGPCTLTYTANIRKSPISFRWDYHTDDIDGPGFDLFGVLLDGVRHQLSDPGGAIDQGGDERFAFANSFGFYIDCTDCLPGFGAATVVISNLRAPEPASLALLGLGLIGLAAMRGRARC